MNPWISAGLGAGAGVVVGHLLTQKKGVAYSVVYIAGSAADADEVRSVLYGLGLDPVMDYSADALRGRGIPRMWLVAVPDDKASKARELIKKYRSVLTNPPQLEPLPQQEPAPSLPDPREV